MQRIKEGIRRVDSPNLRLSNYRSIVQETAVYYCYHYCQCRFNVYIIIILYYIPLKYLIETVFFFCSEKGFLCKSPSLTILPRWYNNKQDER